MRMIRKHRSIEKYGTVVCKGGEPIQITGFTFTGYPNILYHSVVVDALQWAADKILAEIERLRSVKVETRCTKGVDRV